MGLDPALTTSVFRHRGLRYPATPSPKKKVTDVPPHPIESAIEEIRRLPARIFPDDSPDGGRREGGHGGGEKGVGGRHSGAARLGRMEQTRKGRRAAFSVSGGIALWVAA
jgi:transposase InsO family protein